MALSEHEQRMLDAIERALYEDDPKFANSVDPARLRRRRPILSAALFVLGLVALVVGVIATQSLLALGVVVSVLGFVVMVGAVGLFVYGQPGSRGFAPPRKPGKVSSSLSERMEERFRRRFEDQ
ncbi:MAG TPA: DUF3040 domain-containing protein [Nakamurella sp.]|jgi:hypothetical protein|nr:DUF3040 domain-containing protein [Nakamurella sp.]